MVATQQSQQEARPQRLASRRELALAVAATVVLSALFVILASVHGALGASRNDDWSYLRIAFDFARDRHFHVDGWIQTMLIGHTLLAWPIIEVFGRSVTALQMLGVVAGAVGIVCCYALLRRFLPPSWSALACLTLALGPIFASLAVSYMTDTTAFAAQAATLLLGVRALEARSPRQARWLLAGAALTGFAAFSIREYGIVAFPAVLVVAIARSWRDPRERTRLIRIAIAFMVVSVALLAWRRSLPGTVSPTLDTRPGPADAKDLMRLPTTLGLLVSPAVLAVSPVRALKRAWAADPMFTVIALGFGAICLIGSGATFLGNYVTASGSYPASSLLHSASRVIPHAVYSLARLLGAYAVMVGALVLARVFADVTPILADRRALRSCVRRAADAAAPTIVALFSVTLTAIYIFAIAATTETFFDRYLILLVPFVAALVLVACRRYDLFWSRPTIMPVAALVVFTAIGLVYADASATIDGAKWRAAERLVSAGYKPATIDAGYEWFGLHQNDAVVADWRTRRGELATRLFSPRPVCATVVLNGTEQGARETARGETVLFRTDARTLLGRRVIVIAVRGPTRCAPTP